MRIEIDHNHKIVDIFVEDDNGKEVREGFSFESFKQLVAHFNKIYGDLEEKYDKM